MEIVCPYCNSTNIIKKGVRKGKLKQTQLYFCKQCKKAFVQSTIKKVKYPERTILRAISFYNLGHTQREVAKLMARRFHTKVPERTIGSWVNKFKDVCTFSRLRKKATEMFFPDNIIFSHKLQHKQVYEFKLHRAKFVLQARELPQQKFQLLKAYLEKIHTEAFPHHIFTIPDEVLEKRASQLKARLLRIEKLEKQNLANKLAELGLILAKPTKKGINAYKTSC